MYPPPIFLTKAPATLPVTQEIALCRPFIREESTVSESDRQTHGYRFLRDASISTLPQALLAELFAFKPNPLVVVPASSALKFVLQLSGYGHGILRHVPCSRRSNQLTVPRIRILVSRKCKIATVAPLALRAFFLVKICARPNVSPSKNCAHRIRVYIVRAALVPLPERSEWALPHSNFRAIQHNRKLLFSEIRCTVTNSSWRGIAVE